MSTFHSLKILNVIKETNDAVSLIFEIPNTLRTAFEFIPGQYVTISFKINNNELRRSYSICSTPNESNLKITIKAVENGTFSVYANSNIKPGDYLDVSSPEGRFTLENQANKSTNYLAFSAGSGITPVFSIIKSVLKNEPNSTFVLVYGNKTPELTIFHEELHQLELKYTGRFFIHFVYSKANVEHQLFGRIDKSVVNYFIRNKYQSIDFDQFFICGPEQMIDTIYDTLIENNFNEDQIKFELFTSSSKETQITQTDAQCEVTILVDDEEITFVMSNKLTILDAALKQGLDVPYSCQGGICSSCLCRVTEGSVTMKKNSILTDSEIEEGLVLSCQAVPTTPTVKIDYDDI